MSGTLKAKLDAVFPKPGEVVDVLTQRFGRATVKVITIGQEWIDVEIVKGFLTGTGDEWGPGDRKSLRIEHCYFYPAA